MGDEGMKFFKLNKKFKAYQLNCPICGSVMIRPSKYDEFCNNKCFFSYRNNGYVQYIIFGEEMASYWYDDNPFKKISAKEKVEKQIQYWKENDRYLMRILANE